MLTQEQRLDAWHKALEDTLSAHTVSIGHLEAKGNAHAEDIANLTRITEHLIPGFSAQAEDISELSRRLEQVYREHRNAIFCLKSDIHTLREHPETLAEEKEE